LHSRLGSRPATTEERAISIATSAADSAATARLAKQPLTQTFTALAQRVREQGLVGRTPVFYIVLLAVLVLALGGVVTGVVLLQESWLQLLMAGALGIILTQFAFMGHEASHRQIFTSGRANDRYGRLLAVGVVGISYSWWMNKHNRHHANPNKVGKDPDIDADTISFLEDDAAASKGLVRWITRRQGYLFFPLLLLEGLNLHLKSVRSLIDRGRLEGKWWELVFLVLRFTIFLSLLFWALPFGMACAFLGVQLAVFGLYMGASFAPNHKGMPIFAKDDKIDYLRRQVITSRNVRGGRFTDFALGGLNYQIEHHLFPSMPRPGLRRAQSLVRAFCAQHDVAYCETSLFHSYALVLRHLHEVGGPLRPDLEY
jgi:fatty acid desaturase